MPKPLPDLTKAFDRLFAKRPDRPMVFGHAFFQKKTTPSPATPPAAGGPPSVPAPATAGTGAWWSRLMARVTAVRRWKGASSVVGLDLGASAIKLVQVAQVGGAPQVVGLACEEYPPHAEGKTQEQFLQDRLQAFKRRGLLDGRLVIGVPNDQLVFELATIPKMPSGDLIRAVSWEAKERLATDLSAYSVRHLIVGETATDGQAQYEIVIVAAPREGIVSQWRAFSGQGFRVMAMEPGILASLAACEASGVWRAQEFVAFLEIGRRHSTLAFVVQGMVRFVRSFPIAGDSITQSIVDYCQTDYETAESKKRETGLSQMVLEEDRRVTGLEVDPRVRVSHALGLYLERLAAEIDHSIRYFTYELGQAKNRKLDGLYLLGGGALLKNLSAFLSSRLSTRVETADPFKRCALGSEAKRQLQLNEGARLALALGLALHPLTK